MTVALVATGGTIASLRDPATGAVRPAVSPEELARGLDDVRVEDVARVNGWNVTPATMLEVSRRVAAALSEEDVEGAVVTHGTDTVEETAFLCDITVASDKPVAFAAAMRSGSEIGADGPRNLACAVDVARAPAARGLGAVLVLGDEIHSARWARKVDSFRTSAFGSPGHGPVGTVTPGSLDIFVSSPRRFLVDRPHALDRPVPVVQAYTGIEEGLIEAVLDVSGASGLVIEGTGLGNVPGSAERGISAAISRGLPVVIATRVPAGGTGTVYGGPGGGVTLRELGVIEAGGVSAAKARLLLMTLLAEGADVRARFEEAVETMSRW
jgi:L-asparaginase